MEEEGVMEEEGAMEEEEGVMVEEEDIVEEEGVMVGEEGVMEEEEVVMEEEVEAMEGAEVGTFKDHKDSLHQALASPPVQGYVCPAVCELCVCVSSCV